MRENGEKFSVPPVPVSPNISVVYGFAANPNLFSWSGSCLRRTDWRRPFFARGSLVFLPSKSNVAELFLRDGSGRNPEIHGSVWHWQGVIVSRIPATQAHLNTFYL